MTVVSLGEKHPLLGSESGGGGLLRTRVDVKGSRRVGRPKTGAGVVGAAVICGAFDSIDNRSVITIWTETGRPFRIFLRSQNGLYIGCPGRANKLNESFSLVHRLRRAYSATTQVSSGPRACHISRISSRRSTPTPCGGGSVDDL